MFYIVFQHTLGQGGVLSASTTLNYNILYFFEIISFCAVDCFALISGYVGYREDDKNLKLSRYLNLWLQVVFYGVLFVVLFKIIMPDKVMVSDYIKALLPATFGPYWYFRAYTGLFFITPLINTLVQKADDKVLKKFVLISILVFSFYSCLKDTFVLQVGYSFAWITILYFIGAVMKKTGLFINPSCKHKLLLILFFAFIGELWSIIVGGISMSVSGGDAIGDTLVKYVSPTILGIAILHIVLVVNLKLPRWLEKFVKYTAPGAFSVYIINNHSCVWRLFMEDRFIYLGKASVFIALFEIVGFSLLFVSGSVALDFLRRKLFEKIHVNKLVGQVDRLISGFFKKAYSFCLKEELIR